MNFKGIAMSPSISFCPEHTHRYWELIYQVDHPTTATVCGDDYPVGAGELIVIPPGVPHSTAAESPFCDISMQMEIFDFPTLPTVVQDADGHILSLLTLMVSLRNDRSKDNAPLLERLSDVVAMLVSRTLSELREPPAVTHVKRLLAENVGNAWFDLGKTLAGLGYHPDYFRRSFKRATSLSPLAYLNRMRIGRAKDLLRLEPSLSVGDIACRCGFRDPLYFSTAFKRAVGVSPLTYRKRHL